MISPHVTCIIFAYSCNGGDRFCERMDNSALKVEVWQTTLSYAVNIIIPIGFMHRPWFLYYHNSFTFPIILFIWSIILLFTAKKKANSWAVEGVFLLNCQVACSDTTGKLATRWLHLYQVTEECDHLVYWATLAALLHVCVTCEARLAKVQFNWISADQ